MYDNGRYENYFATCCHLKEVLSEDHYKNRKFWFKLYFALYKVQLLKIAIHNIIVVIVKVVFLLLLTYEHPIDLTRDGPV